MHSIKISGNNDISITQEVLHKLIDILPSIKSRLTSSNWIACIHKYIETFPESAKNLEGLWILLRDRIELNIKNEYINEMEIDILIQFIDDFKSIQCNFHDDAILVSTIQCLLKSDQRKYKKCGHFLLKKFIQYYIQFVYTFGSKWMSADHNQQLERSWIMYVTLLENLDEEQSHLILPSLENLEELVKSKHLPLPWMKILYCRILTHNNILVRRWSIEFFLRTFSCSDICEETLKHLLNATNCNTLFNCEGYFLEISNYSSFLGCDAEVLFRLLAEIENWKSVPLYMWIESFAEIQLQISLTFEEILQISCCVRKLQNCSIREKTIEKCKQLFKNCIEKMSMKEYVKYIETIHNPGDRYLDHEVLFSKKSCLTQSEQTDYIYKQRFYEIFTNHNWNNADLLSFLRDIPVEKHGWLKFAIFKYHLDENDVNLISNMYKLELNALKFLDIHKIVEIFKNSLISCPSLDKHEVIECNQAAISFYIHQKNSFEINEEDTLRFILNTGLTNNNVLDTFAEKFLNNKVFKIDMWFIDELLKYNSEKMLKYVFNYLRTFNDENIIKKYAVIILKKNNFELGLFEDINLLDYYTDEWLKKSTSQGDKRIEEAFLFTYCGMKNNSKIEYYLRQVDRYHNEQFVLNLLKCHKDITKKKPRYFENSNEHRVKLRIAVCIYNSKSLGMSSDVLDQIWDILINENNQLNITYIYEHILGSSENSEDVIIQKLKEAQNLTSSQQASIISVAYIYSKYHNLTCEMQKALVYTLLSLSMGPNFQIRLLAQMSLCHYLQWDDKDEQRSLLKFDALLSDFKSECWNEIIKSIKLATGTKLNEYLNEIRLNIYKGYPQIKIILYVTNVPFDELIYNNDWNDIPDLFDEYKKIEMCREFYLKKLQHTEEICTTSTNTTNDQLQRKMNPVNDLNVPHNLVAYPIKEKTAEMIVVATLIDKLPNLGGIARTCEVLGIENLVMDSKMYTEKADFKNLSMTAEKTLNILEIKSKDLKEFLMLKKLEGYIIIGAEQTCKSQNFGNYVFPPKCVLLLGHEKGGIPAPLLGILDEAVEIPQFGQVRSLNVHVTAALFIWEYCKQHLIPK